MLRAFVSGLSLRLRYGRFLIVHAKRGLHDLLNGRQLSCLGYLLVSLLTEGVYPLLPVLVILSCVLAFIESDGFQLFSYLFHSPGCTFLGCYMQVIY